MGGQSINVIKAFNLLLNEAEMAAAKVSTNLLRFNIGRHDDVPDVIASHPQVKLHCGTDDQLSGVLVAPSASTVDMVPRADLEAAQGEVAELRAQVDDLTTRLSVQGSVVEGLQAQVRQAGEARAQSESDLGEAAQRIRDMAVRLNIPAESVLPASMVAPADEAPAAAPPPVAPAQDAAAPTPAPEGQTSSNPESQASGDPAAAEAPAITVQHKGAGRYAVFRGEEQVTEPTTREEADAQAAQMAAQPPAADPAAAAASETPPAAPAA